MHVCPWMEEAKGALVADWSSNQQNHNLRFVVLLTCWLVADGELRGGNEKARYRVFKTQCISQ